MEKSIESIWKEGFLKQDVLIAPEINKLYNRQSIHLIEKFEKAFQINIRAIIVAAIVIFIASFLIGATWAGLVILCMLAYVAYTAKQELEALHKVRKVDNSYTFLYNFKTWINHSTERYGKMYRWLYPMLLLSFYFGAWYSDLLEDLRNRIIESGEPLLWGTHQTTTIIILAFALLMTLFSKAIHRLDVKLIYGRIIKKLDTALRDMEELL